MIRWQDKILDTEVPKTARMQSVHSLLELAQLRWIGHVTRMPDERLPRKTYYGELQVGKCSQGNWKKRYKDTLTVSQKYFNIHQIPWKKSAQGREKWRCLSRTGADDYESARLNETAKSAKPEPEPEPRNHQQSPHFQNWLALFARDSYE